MTQIMVKINIINYPKLRTLLVLKQKVNLAQQDINSVIVSQIKNKSRQLIHISFMHALLWIHFNKKQFATKFQLLCLKKWVYVIPLYTFWFCLEALNSSI